MGEFPADWAIERAIAELGPLSCYDKASEVKHFAVAPIRNRIAGSVVAFARYIEQHEQPPVDPLLIEARVIAAETRQPGFFALRSDVLHETVASKIATGLWDDHQLVQAALAALRRGIELTKAPSDG